MASTCYQKAILPLTFHDRKSVMFLGSEWITRLIIFTTVPFQRWEKCTQRSEETCPRAPSWQVSELGLPLKQSGSSIWTLKQHIVLPVVIVPLSKLNFALIQYYILRVAITHIVCPYLHIYIPIYILHI